MIFQLKLGDGRNTDEHPFYTSVQRGGMRALWTILELEQSLYSWVTGRVGGLLTCTPAGFEREIIFYSLTSFHVRTELAKPPRLKSRGPVVFSGSPLPLDLCLSA